MADNVLITPGSGDTVAADDVGSVKYQRVKVTLGADGVNDGDIIGNSGVVGATTQRVVHATDVATSMNIVGVNTTNTLGVHIASTSGTINVFNITQGTVAVSAKDGTFAVYFSPANPAVGIISGQPQVAGNSGVVGATTQRVVHATDVATSMNIVAIGTTNTLGVYLSSTAGTIGVDVGKVQNIDFITRVRNLVDGTLTTVSNVTSITNALPAGTNDLGNVIRVKNLVDGTLSTVTRVSNVVDGTLTTVTTVGRVNNIVAGTVTITGTNSSLAVFLDPGHLLGSVTANAGTGTMTVAFDPGHTLGSLIANQSVNAAQFNGGTAVTPNTGIPLINTGSTMQVFTVSGSTSGISVSGVNLVAPSASYNFKVFAYSLQTTGAVSLTTKFVNGAGGSQVELWRPMVTASGVTGAQGANLAVAPPAFLFATGTNTSLNLLLDTATLTHYSVSYIKESA